MVSEFPGQTVDPGELEVHDPLEVLLGERLEDDDVVHPVQELGAEVPLHLPQHRLLHLLGPSLPEGLEDVLASDVRGHDDDRVPEVDRASLAVRQATVVEDLEEHVEHLRVGLLDLVEEDDRVGPAPHGLGELPPFLEAHVPRRRPDQAGYGVLLHVLRHVDADHGPLVVEEELGQGPGRLGLSHTGRPEEDERAHGTIRILKPGPGPAHGVRHRRHRLGLAHDALAEEILQVRQPVTLGLQQPAHGDPRPLSHHPGDVVGVDLLLEERPARLELLQPLVRHHDGLLGTGDLGVLDLRGPPQVSGAGRPLGFDPQLVHPLLEGLQPLDRLLLGLPAGLHARRLLPELTQLRFDRLPAFHRRALLLLLQGALLDLELGDPALHLVDLLGHRVDLDPQATTGLVHEVDGLVRQESPADVAIGELHRRDQGVVGDPHPVVDLVPLLESPENGDGVLHRRWCHEHGLEAPLQGRVLLDVLPVLVEGGGAHHPELAPGQGRLQHVAGVDGPLGGTGPHHGVELVQEDDVPAVGLGDLLQHRLEALFELAAVLGAGEHGGDVEGHQLLVREGRRHVPVDDALGQAFHDGGLPDSGLPDQDRVVLRAAGQDLHDTPDLVVSTDDGIELALAGHVRQVTGVAGQRLDLLLGVLVHDPVGSPDGFQRLPDPVQPGPGFPEDPAGVVLLRGQPEEEVLRGDELIAQRPGLLLRRVQSPAQVPGDPGVRPALHPGHAVHRLTDLTLHPGHGDLELLQDGDDDPLLLAQKRVQEVDTVDLGVPPIPGLRGGVLDGLAGLHRELVVTEHRRSVG